MTRMTRKMAVPGSRPRRDGFSDGVGGVEGDLIFHAGGKRWPGVEFGDALLVNVERVGGGKLSDRDTDRFAPL